MRIFLLRALLGWWVIIGAWILIFPLIYLLSGDARKAKSEVIEFCKFSWYGE